jgi:hypothetical protein
MDEEVIPILRVSDAFAAAAWYKRLGFSQEWEHRFEPGLPAFVSVARVGCGCSYPSTLATPVRTTSCTSVSTI